VSHSCKDAGGGVCSGAPFALVVATTDMSTYSSWFEYGYGSETGVRVRVWVRPFAAFSVQ